MHTLVVSMEYIPTNVPCGKEEEMLKNDIHVDKYLTKLDCDRRESVCDKIE